MCDMWTCEICCVIELAKPLLTGVYFTSFLFSLQFYSGVAVMQICTMDEGMVAGKRPGHDDIKRNSIIVLSVCICMPVFEELMQKNHIMPSIQVLRKHEMLFTHCSQTDGSRQ